MLLVYRQMEKIVFAEAILLLQKLVFCKKNEPPGTVVIEMLKGG